MVPQRSVTEMSSSVYFSIDKSIIRVQFRSSQKKKLGPHYLKFRDFGGLVVKTVHFHCRGHRFNS